MKKEVIKGLDQTKVDDGRPRMTGVTTRLIDKYIQELFTTGYVVAESEWKSAQGHRELADVMRNRLRMEHGQIYFFSDVIVREVQSSEGVSCFQLVHQEEEEVLQDDFDIKLNREIPTGEGALVNFEKAVDKIPYKPVTEQEYLDILEARTVEMNEDDQPPFTKEPRNYEDEIEISRPPISFKAELDDTSEGRED